MTAHPHLHYHSGAIAQSMEALSPSYFLVWVVSLLTFLVRQASRGRGSRGGVLFMPSWAIWAAVPLLPGFGGVVRRTQGSLLPERHDRPLWALTLRPIKGSRSMWLGPVSEADHLGFGPDFATSLPCDAWFPLCLSASLLSEWQCEKSQDSAQQSAKWLLTFTLISPRRGINRLLWDLRWGTVYLFYLSYVLQTF